jgi:hypothetical protein
MSLKFPDAWSSILMGKKPGESQTTVAQKQCKFYPVEMPVELNIGRGSRKAGIERLNE